MLFARLSFRRAELRKFASLNLENCGYRNAWQFSKITKNIVVLAKQILLTPVGFHGIFPGSWKQLGRGDLSSKSERRRSPIFVFLRVLACVYPRKLWGRTDRNKVCFGDSTAQNVVLQLMYPIDTCGKLTTSSR